MTDERQKQMDWTTFYFDGNQAWGLIDSAEAWAAVKAQYAGHIDDVVDRAMNCPDATPPKFGFVVECNGPMSLRQFFEQHGMTP